MSAEEEKPAEKLPNLELQQWAFLLSLPDGMVPKKAEFKQKLMDYITANDMAPYYKYVCETLQWTVDQPLLDKMEKVNEEKLAALIAKYEDAQTNQGESEVRDALEERANYYCRIGDKDKAVQAYRETNEKTVGLGGKIDLVFSQIRLGLFYADSDLIQRNIEKANSLVEQGGDWDRRNRLKVYEGMFAMSRRDFRTSARKLLDSVATFTSTEVLAFPEFVFYTVTVALLALDRLDLKKSVVQSPEILAVIDEMPDARDLMNALYNCNYRVFMRSLMKVYDALQRDRYMASHADFYCREMRIKGYTQFLDSYKSVTMASMARAFGIGTDALDTELSRFIAAHRLNCKIDKVNGVIETTRPDTRNAQYLETVKLSDTLLHRMQKLSRVVNV